MEAKNENIGVGKKIFVKKKEKMGYNVSKLHVFWFYTIKNDRTTQYIPLRADLLILYLECSLDPGPDLRHEAQLAGEYLGEEDGDHLLARPLTLLLKTSDVDPDQVGSPFIWVRGSESRGIK